MLFTCISDPDTAALLCTDAEGEMHSIPFKETANYVCMKPLEFKRFVESCR